MGFQSESDSSQLCHRLQYGTFDLNHYGYWGKRFEQVPSIFSYQSHSLHYQQLLEFSVYPSGLQYFKHLAWDYCSAGERSLDLSLKSHLVSRHQYAGSNSWCCSASCSNDHHASSCVRLCVIWSAGFGFLVHESEGWMAASSFPLPVCYPQSVSRPRFHHF